MTKELNKIKKILKLEVANSKAPKKYCELYITDKYSIVFYLTEEEIQEIEKKYNIKRITI